MLIRPDERQIVHDICREEMEEANRRIAERLRAIQSRPRSCDEDEFESIRRFYEDLTDNVWSKADEECLSSLSSEGVVELKRLMREGFRLSPVHPAPNFKYLINIVKRSEAEGQAPFQCSHMSTDAVPSSSRERLANLLDEQLRVAADDIVLRLKLNESNETVVRERLEMAQGHIIGDFTPLA